MAAAAAGRLAPGNGAGRAGCAGREYDSATAKNAASLATPPGVASASPLVRPQDRLRLRPPRPHAPARETRINGASATRHAVTVTALADTPTATRCDGGTACSPLSRTFPSSSIASAGPSGGPRRAAGDGRAGPREDKCGCLQPVLPRRKGVTGWCVFIFLSVPTNLRFTLRARRARLCPVPRPPPVAPRLPAGLPACLPACPSGCARCKGLHLRAA